MVKIQLSFKYSEFHVNYFTIFSLITTLSTNVTKSLQCKGIFFSDVTWRHACRDPTSPNLITTRKRQRNILWFNLPYSKTVKTKIGKFFLPLIKKHFPKEHKFHKIFNRNTPKLGYSWMPNIKAKINAHNRVILRNTPSKNAKGCNCQQKRKCPMNGDCLKERLVYYATISCNDKNYKPKLYKGSCETSFKKRYSNHKKSFNVPFYKHDTKLSTEYWNLKMKQLNPQISWKIKGIYKSYNPTSKRCNLCLTEKLDILDDPDKNLLNKDQKSSPSVVTGISIDLKH